VKILGKKLFLTIFLLYLEIFFDIIFSLISFIRKINYLGFFMVKKIILVISLLSTLNAETLQQTLNELLSTNPVIQERLKNYNALKEDITTAEAGYYPKIDLRLGMGEESTQRDNLNTNYTVYENSLQYTQNLFNGFNTKNLVKEQEYRTLGAAYSYIEKVNATSLAMVNSYLDVIKNQELLTTSVENVKIDEDILKKVKKLYQSGLTTLSEVNKIEASLALAKSNLVVQENNILNAAYNLEKILGHSIQAKNMTKPLLNQNLFPQTREEAISFALKNNPSLLVSQYNIKVAEATHKRAQSQFYPKIDIEISQTFNHNISTIEGKNNVFRAMAYFSYNIFNGFSDSAATQKSISQIHQEVESKHTIKRDIIQSLSLSWAAREKLKEQLTHLIEYKNFANKTLVLYAKEYDLGRRSLLDLLSAQNDFIQSKAQIITARYNILSAEYKILDSMGILVKTLLGDKKKIYKNVGIETPAPENNDIIPIQYDKDNDLIVDDMDLCDNSTPFNMKNLYGCSYSDKNVTQIERYSGFTFNGEKLTKTAKRKIEQLIKQLSPYGLKNIEFKLLSNTQNERKTEKQLYKLSTKRANRIKSLLVRAGANAANIQIISNGNHAPMYSGNDSRNNRVDIIVKKLKKGDN